MIVTVHECIDCNRRAIAPATEDPAPYWTKCPFCRGRMTAKLDRAGEDYVGAAPFVWTKVGGIDRLIWNGDMRRRIT